MRRDALAKINSDRCATGRFRVDVINSIIIIVKVFSISRMGSHVDPL